MRNLFSQANPRKARLALAATVLAGVLGFASGAQAATPVPPIHTKYYSINVGQAVGGQFLTATSTGEVNLQRYESGEMRQQWAPVLPTWPVEPDLQGGSIVWDFFHAFGECIANAGCPFAAPGEKPQIRRFVNRQYGLCLSFVPNTKKIAVDVCKRTPSSRRSQAIASTISETAGVGSTFSTNETFLMGQTQGHPACIRKVPGGNGVDPIGTEAIACNPSRPPSQSFRFLMSAEVDCTGRSTYWDVCGLGAPLRVV